MMIPPKPPSGASDVGYSNPSPGVETLEISVRGSGASVRTRRHVELFELLIWVYQRQRVIQETGKTLHGIEASWERDYEPHGHSADGIVLLQRRGAVGCSIDGGDYRGLGAKVDRDAEIIHAAVLAMSDWQREIIVAHAQTGMEPIWSDGRTRLVKVPMAGKGSYDPHTGEIRAKTIAKRDDWLAMPAAAREALGPLVDWDKNGNPRAFCPVVETPSPVFTEMVNGVYSAWHEAMSELLATLQAIELTSWKVTGFAAPARPWGRTWSEPMAPSPPPKWERQAVRVVRRQAVVQLEHHDEAERSLGITTYVRRVRVVLDRVLDPERQRARLLRR